MVERRGRPGAIDIGLRTRRTDRIPTARSPHENPDWASTYHLRWSEHSRHGDRSDRKAA